MELTTSGYTCVGRRATNQDALFMDTELGLYLVADGMGGYAGGEVASALAVETITRFYRENQRDRERTWPFGIDLRRSFCENLARSAIEVAHRAVVRARTGARARMGSTVALLSLCERRGVIAHLGDSRAYRLRAGTLELLTRDHSLVEELKQMSPDKNFEGAESAYAHVITRALGIDTAQGADVRRVTPRVGDLYLLCSDGLSGALTHDAMRRILQETPAERAAQALVDAAYEAGSQDNITAVVASLTE